MAAAVELAQAAVRGEIPGSSAGGEQPKFTAYAETPDGPRHLLIKFTLPEANPVPERWRDLLLTEHHAQETLNAHGIPAARSRVLDHGGQRFLAVERFDRVGTFGRRGLLSLAALDAEFIGNASASWPVLVQTLARAGHTTREAAETACVLHAFGALIGNTDMHHGNLSFTSTAGRPYPLAPAYDMLSMGFAPRVGGGLTPHLPSVTLRPEISAAHWHTALVLAREFLARLQAETRLSPAFSPCREALHRHVSEAAKRITRLH